MAKRIPITANHLFDFADVLNGHHLIAVSVGPSLDPILLSLKQSPDYRKSTSGGDFPKRQAACPNQFRVHSQVAEEWSFLDLSPTRENYHAVQPLRQGRWLLVCGRAGVDDRNAHVYELDGTPGLSFHAGDGIADVQATERDRVWVSYFDEGVFGKTPLGRSGLACFDQDGRPVFRLDELPDPVLQSMADCYAMNVCSDRETWLYFYTDFPLVRLVEGKVAGAWSMPIEGSHGFAVGKKRVLFSGSYNQRSSLFLGRLDTLKFEELTPVDSKRRQLRTFRGIGRRDCLFLATDESLHVVEMKDL